MKEHYLPILLLGLGWLTHWLSVIKKARALATAGGQAPPSLLSYWTADPYTVALSVVGVIVVYFVLPWMAVGWPALAAVIGSTPDQPMNPLAAYFGGYVAPSLADFAGNRLKSMVGV